jgi:predicted nucleotidyltransferase
MIDVFEKLVEGYFLTTIEGLKFEVKGVVHPQDRTIAYVRYVPNTNLSESGFRKIYDLHERDKYLKSYYPEYLWFSESHGRVLQAVPHNKVDQILDPVEHMVQIRENSDALSISTKQLVDLLVEYTGVDKADIGVTGSQLVGEARETSDIDLVVFGESACNNFYKKLKRNFDVIPNLQRYTGNLLRKHLVFRWQELTEYHNILERIENRKCLQGIFGTHHFFIRLVKRPYDITEYFGQIVSENLGPREIQCMIVNDRESIFTPCTYRVESSNLPELKRIISYRGRFTEQVSQGDIVKAKGRLEHVSNLYSNETYQQLVLGENPSDYMIPQ